MHRTGWAILAIAFIALVAVPAASTAAEADPHMWTGWSARNDTSEPMREVAIRVLGTEGFPREIPIQEHERQRGPLGEELPDAARQSEYRPIADAGVTPSPDLSVVGLTEQDNVDVVGLAIVPPDINGDVGPNYYVQFINLVWGVFDKSTGARVAGPFAGNSFWQGLGGPCESTNDGDPIVLYDDEAGRWMVSQFAINTGSQCVAVSTTGDPLGSYHQYEFVVTPDGLNDYPKLGVWTDGAGQSAYTVTTRDFVGFFGFNLAAHLFERDEMLVGNPAQFVTRDLPCTTSNCVEGLLPIHLAGPVPPTGVCPTFWAASDTQFDDDGSNSVDGYRNWELCVDWSNPSSSSFFEKPIVASTPFNRAVGNGFSACVPTPGENVDCLSIFTMFRAQFRWFDDPQSSFGSVVLNHTVDVNGNDLNGVRWAEVRLHEQNLGTRSEAWTLHQDGTYSPDNDHRWMGSVAQDRGGNIALGYSVANNSLNPAVRYTSRMAGDALGTLPGGEVSCHEGGGAQTGSAGRWGDYSSMSAEEDSCTFWYTQEYYQTTGSFDFDTRICSFTFDTCPTGYPIGISVDSVSPGTANATNTWSVTGAAPNSTVDLVCNLNGNTNQVTAGSATADGAGTASISRFIPSGASGRRIECRAEDSSGNVSTKLIELF